MAQPTVVEKESYFRKECIRYFNFIRNKMDLGKENEELIRQQVNNANGKGLEVLYFNLGYINNQIKRGPGPIKDQIELRNSVIRTAANFYTIGSDPANKQKYYDKMNTASPLPDLPVGMGKKRMMQRTINPSGEITAGEAQDIFDLAKKAKRKKRRAVVTRGRQVRF